MKKNVMRLFAAVLALSCALTLSACSGGGESSSSMASGSSVSSTVEDSSSQSSESSAAEDSSSVQESSSDGETAGLGLYSSMEEFVNSDEIQSQLASMNTDEMGVSVTGEGNKLTYTYTFNEGMDGVDTETLKASLEAAMESQVSTFEGIASTLAQVVDVENPVVVVTYQDSQGNVIYTREFAAQ